MNSASFGVQIGFKKDGKLLLRAFSRRRCAVLALAILICITAPAPASQVVGWGATTVPYAAALDKYTNVVAKDEQSFAIKTDGTIVGWGRNNHGQTAPPAGLSNIVLIGVGRACTIALDTNGNIYAWGDSNS